MTTISDTDEYLFQCKKLAEENEQHTTIKSGSGYIITRVSFDTGQMIIHYF